MTPPVDVRPDIRPLSVRIKTLADAASARAAGFRKAAAGQVSAAVVAEREAAWLTEAVVIIKKVEG